MIPRLPLLILLLAAISLPGCRPKHQPAELGDGPTIAGGKAKVDVGLDGAERLIDKTLTVPQLPGNAPPLLRGAKANIGVARQGAKELKQAGDAALRESDESRKGFNSRLDWGTFLGGIALALGVALVVTGKPAGIGLAVFGGILALAMMTIRASSPVLPWVAAGLGVIAVAAAAYLVYWRLKVYRQLKTEETATRDLVKTVDVLAKHVPEEKHRELFHGVIPTLQHETTEKLVKDAKQTLGMSTGEVEVKTPDGETVAQAPAVTVTAT